MRGFLLLGLLMMAWQSNAQIAAARLVSSEFLGTTTRAELMAVFPLAQNAVDAYKITYTTLDLEGQLDTASGFVGIPIVDGVAFPVGIYQHGTVNSPEDVPSRGNAESFIPMVFAGMGFLSIAPDYLGLGDSRGFHPYVHAETEASAAIDMLIALDEFATQQGLVLNGQHFVTGYSQGGHAAMALHRELEFNYADVFPVTASAPLSGPYSISEEMLNLLVQDVEYFFPSYAVWTFLSYNLVYDLYDTPTAVFKPPFDSLANEFLQYNITTFEMNQAIVDELIANFGESKTRNLFQDSILTVLEARDTSHPIIQALIDNDTYLWAPQAPTRLYYCQGDDQVVFTNSVLADSVMNVLGAADLASANLGTNFDHGQCVIPALTNTILFFLPLVDQVTNTKTVSAQPFKIWPNPSRGWFQVQDGRSDEFLQVTDAAGREVYTTRLSGGQEIIQLPDLPNGLYYVQLRGPDQYRIQKLILQR